MPQKNSETIKGFRDYGGKEAEKRAVVREVIRQTFERYGFGPAETPIIESEEFVRGENSNDEAVRDIFKLEDRGKRKLALRYEFTFQLKRLAKNKKLPYKRYQIGYNFRDEPIRVGRTRQFIQCDADIVGSTLKDEAENLSMFKEVLDALKIEYTIYINNRKLLNEILEKAGIKKDKEMIIKELDKLDKLSEKEVKKNLERFGAGKVLGLFKQKEEFFEKYESYGEIKQLKNYCKLFGVKVEFRPYLARGFSYYNGSVFEVWSKKLPVSICGGGSYMVENNQSTGISFGFETLLLLTNLKIQLEKYLIISLEQDRAAIGLAQKMRKKNKIVSMYYGKPSKALEYANVYGFQRVIFVGAREVKERKFKVKIMSTGKESLLKI